MKVKISSKKEKINESFLLGAGLFVLGGAVVWLLAKFWPAARRFLRLSEERLEQGANMVREAVGPKGGEEEVDPKGDDDSERAPERRAPSDDDDEYRPGVSPRTEPSAVLTQEIRDNFFERFMASFHRLKKTLADIEEEQKGQSRANIGEKPSQLVAARVQDLVMITENFMSEYRSAIQDDEKLKNSLEGAINNFEEAYKIISNLDFIQALTSKKNDKGLFQAFSDEGIEDITFRDDKVWFDFTSSILKMIPESELKKYKAKGLKTISRRG